MKKLLVTFSLLAILSLNVFAGDTPIGGRTGGDPCPTCSTAPDGGDTPIGAITYDPSLFESIFDYLNSLLP